MKIQAEITYPPYIIITSDSLKNAFTPLINWLKKKGLPANIYSVDSIISNTSVNSIFEINDDAGKIRTFLKKAYTGGAQWLLLGGDEEIIPVRYGTCENNDTSTTENTPADLYYSDFDGKWDVDGDELYGEPVDDSVDYYPELFTGRIPCHRSQQISDWIEKLLSYSKNPGNSNPAYLKRVLWIAADELRDNPAYILDNNPYPLYYEQDTSLLEDTSGFTPHGSKVINRMNEHFGWFNLYGHGAPDQLIVFAPGDGDYSPERDFIVSLDTCEKFYEQLRPNGCRVEIGNGFDSLQNADYYGIMYLSSCYQGAYDEEKFTLFDNYPGPCMAEAFTLLPQKGGPAFIGYTRYAVELPSNVLHLEFLNTIYADSIVEIGAAEALSKVKRYYPHFIHLSNTLFGDPSMSVWIDIPSGLNVTYDDSIPPDSMTFSPEVEDLYGNPVEGALVCIWKENDIYLTDYSDINGIVNFNINPESEGIMLLTTTSNKFLPSEDTVLVSKLASIENIEYQESTISVNRNLSSSNITFLLNIIEKSKTTLEIYDITGRLMRTIIDGTLDKGKYKFRWNGVNKNGNIVNTGIYFCIFRHRGRTNQGKFLLIH